MKTVIKWQNQQTKLQQIKTHLKTIKKIFHLCIYPKIAMLKSCVHLSVPRRETSEVWYPATLDFCTFISREAAVRSKPTMTDGE